MGQHQKAGKTRTCHACERCLPLTTEHWYFVTRPNGCVRPLYRCKQCHSTHMRKQRQTPEGITYNRLVAMKHYSLNPAKYGAKHAAPNPSLVVAIMFYQLVRKLAKEDGTWQA